MMNFKEARSLAVVGCLTITLLVPCLAMAQQAAVDKNNFDMSVRAQDDLFEHVNGTWLKNTKIPSDKSNFGAFTVLIDLSQSRIKTIIDEVSKGNNVKGTDEQRVADLFRSYMNEDRANELGMTPIKLSLIHI